MHVLRTPDEAFASIADYPFLPHYVDVGTGNDGPVRIHYVDEGSGPIVLLMHGEPSWSYLYRKVIPILVDAGFRVLAPDLIGFGKSDKPASKDDYTYARHVSWMQEWLDALDDHDVCVVCPHPKNRPVVGFAHSTRNYDLAPAASAWGVMRAGVSGAPFQEGLYRVAAAQRALADAEHEQADVIEVRVVGLEGAQRMAADAAEILAAIGLTVGGKQDELRTIIR